jgi:hypothetical protein
MATDARKANASTKSRVDLHGASEQVGDLPQILPGVVAGARLQIERIGVEIAGTLWHRRHRPDLHAKVFADRGDNGAGDLVLDVEQVLGRERAVEGFRPQVRVVCAVDQLGGDADAIAALAHAAFQHVAHFQQARDGRNADPLLRAELE